MLLYLTLFAILAGVALLGWRDGTAYLRRERSRRAKQAELRWRPTFRKNLFTDRWALRKTRRLTDQRGSVRDVS